MDPVETYEVDGGYRVSIFWDDCAESPRRWDNVGRLLQVGEPRSWGKVTVDGCDETAQDGEYAVAHLRGAAYAFAVCDDGRVWLDDVNIARADAETLEDAAVVIYVDWETVQREYGTDATAERQARVLATLEGEIETLSQWLEGEVYRWEVLDPDGHYVEGVCGYYSVEDARNEADLAAWGALKEAQAKALRRGLELCGSALRAA